MRATVSFTYDARDIRQILLANAPAGARLELYWPVEASPDPTLVALIRIPDGARDPESITWIPHTASYTAGDDAVLIIDHDTLIDILTTAAADTLSTSGLKVSNLQAAATTVHDHDMSVRIDFPLEELRVPQRATLLSSLT